MTNTKHLILYEFGKRQVYGDAELVDELENLLDNIWSQRKHNVLSFPNIPLRTLPEVERGKQQLLQIFRDHTVKARNYVGIIRHQNNSITIRPKLFKNVPYVAEKIISQHLIWWLQHCHNINLPLVESSVSQRERGDVLEVMMYWFAKLTLNALEESTYHQFETTSRNASVVKGRWKVQQYIKQSLTKGQWHRIPSQYEAFQADNLFNQILKYVANTLLLFAKNQQTKQHLYRISEQLQSISHKNITVQHCEQIHLNPLQSHWQIILNYCRLFLSHASIISSHHALPVLAFLLPMELVFEQFVYGFLQQYFPESKPIFQDSSTFLAKDKLSTPQFPMRQDITLTDDSGKLVIIDCKYKLLENGKPNPQDLYQLATYAIRRACQRVFIIYPTLQTWAHHSQKPNTPLKYYTITDELAQRDIQIGVLGIPFGSVKGDFETLTQILKTKLGQLLRAKY